MRGIVLLSGRRTAREGNICQIPVEKSLLDSVVGKPANLYDGAGIPPTILAFDDGKKERADRLRRMRE
jgi:hypothetical protein